MTSPTKKQTVLPYLLGGATDPHFIGDGNPPFNRPSQPNETEDIGGNWTPDRIEANEDYWSLRDEGRSFGEGESYGERNA